MTKVPSEEPEISFEPSETDPVLPDPPADLFAQHPQKLLLTAVHEAGHVLALESVAPGSVDVVTIQNVEPPARIPRNDASTAYKEGCLQQIPWQQHAAVLLAGLYAELLAEGELTAKDWANRVRRRPKGHGDEDVKMAKELARVAHVTFADLARTARDVLDGLGIGPRLRPMAEFLLGHCEENVIFVRTGDQIRNWLRGDTIVGRTVPQNQSSSPCRPGAGSKSHETV